MKCFNFLNNKLVYTKMFMRLCMELQLKITLLLQFNFLIKNCIKIDK